MSDLIGNPEDRFSHNEAHINSRQSDSQGSNENTKHSVQSDNQSTQHNTINSSNNPKVVKRDITWVTCSDVITCIEPKFLGKYVRIKSFKHATILNLRDNLSNMDI